MDETPANPTQDDTPKTPINSLDAARAVTEALGNTIVPDRIQAREPVAPEATPPAEPTAPIVETPPAETPEPANETPVPTTPTTPAASVVEEEEPEEYIPPAQPVSPIDPKAFVDENGYVDTTKLSEAINGALSAAQQTASATAQRELAAQRIEERQWNSAIEKYPELKTDRTLRDFVQNARIGRTTEMYRQAGNNPQALQAIKIPTPTQMASELFKRMGQAKNEGVQSATETTTVAESNTTLPSGNAAPTTSKREELFKTIRSNDRLTAENAQKELLKDLLFNDNR